MPGGRNADASPLAASGWSTLSASRRSGAHSSGTSADASTTPRPTLPSPDWFPTAPPVGPSGDAPAPNWCSSGRPNADHPPADPLGQHIPPSIANQVVSQATQEPPSEFIPTASGIQQGAS